MSQYDIGATSFSQRRIRHQSASQSCKSPYGKVCAKTRTFGCFKCIKEGDSFGRSIEGYGEEPSIPSITVAAVIVEGARGTIFRIVYFFDCSSIQHHLSSLFSLVY